MIVSGFPDALQAVHAQWPTYLTAELTKVGIEWYESLPPKVPIEKFGAELFDTLILDAKLSYLMARRILDSVVHDLPDPPFARIYWMGCYVDRFL